MVLPRIKWPAIHWQILIALFLAVIFGIYFKSNIHYIAWMGEIFMRALKMIIIPLVFTSIVSAVINIGNSRSLGRLGLKAGVYYISTSILAILTGLILVNIIQPGKGMTLQIENADLSKLEGETLGDILIRLVPENIFLTLSSNQQMLSVILFAILIGFFITQINHDYRETLQKVFNGFSDVMMKMTMFILKFAPLGIFGLVAEKISEQNDLIALVQSMGLYMITIIAGLLLHSVITLPLLVKWIGKVNPFKHFLSVRTPLLTAFSTSSSSATLPLTMQAMREKSGVSDEITSFTLPLGATINMDGTALYECVAVIFIAQVYGIELSFLQQVIVVLTALLASIGAAGIPMAGLVMITIILTAVGLPLEGVGLILAVDRILDMLRTTVNVWSDTCGTVIIARLESER